VDQGRYDLLPGRDFIRDEVAEPHDVDLDEVEPVTGSGARLSAPEYLDCSECPSSSREDAEEYLDELTRTRSSNDTRRTMAAERAPVHDP
jgi:hypothetical protein